MLSGAVDGEVPAGSLAEEKKGTDEATTTGATEVEESKEERDDGLP